MLFDDDAKGALLGRTLSTFSVCGGLTAFSFDARAVRLIKADFIAVGAETLILPAYY